MSKLEQQYPNAVEIVSNIVDCIENEVLDPPRYYVVGGVAAAALMDPETVFIRGIDTRAHMVSPRPDLYKPTLRENGTLGDVDILLDREDYIVDDIAGRPPRTISDVIRGALTPDEKVMNNGSEIARKYQQSKPGAQLKIGVTPLKKESEYTEVSKNPIKRLAKLILKDFVSQRVIDESLQRSFRILGLSVDLPDEYFDVWHQKNGDNNNYIPVMHPVIQMANYIARTSYDEPRDRDVSKLEKMEKVVGPVFGIELKRDKKGHIVGLLADYPNDPAYGSAIEFLDKKLELDYEFNKTRIGSRAAAWFAIKQTLHKPADKYLEKLGQEGWLYDHVLSKANGEKQDIITR